MKVRAIAAATQRSNAVGALELECTPHALVLTYLGVGRFQEGYAPGSLTDKTQVSVPWSAVQAARVEGARLFIQLDPEVSPHNQLMLTNFSSGTRLHPAEVSRQRALFRIFSVAAAAVTAILVTVALPRISPNAGALVALLIAALAALLILFIGAFAGGRVLGPHNDDSDQAREAFIGELRVFFPTLQHWDKPHTPEVKPSPKSFDVQSLLPKTTFGIVIVLSASALAALLTIRWLFLERARGSEPQRLAAGEALAASQPPVVAAPLTATRERPEPIPSASSSPPPKASSESTPAKPAALAPTKPAETSAGGACTCTRSHSPLWDEPIPTMSLLVLSSRLLQKGEKRRVLLDIAVVNNSSEPLRDVTLSVQFYERDPPPSNRRYPVSHRALFYEGPLLPGKAIKWSTEAEGTEFDVENPARQSIGIKGDLAAPANLLAELLNANHRPVRLHGAMMLAYLGDPRARDGALKLKDALREAESPYLQRVLDATGEIKVCDINVGPPSAQTPVSACVYNSSSETKENVGLKLRALESEVSHSYPVAPPPLIVTEEVFEVADHLDKATGKRVNLSWNLSKLSGKPLPDFDAIAGRADLIE